MRIFRPKYLSKETFRTTKTLTIIVFAYFVLLLMDYTSGHQHDGTICLFKIITGYPCPGCGLGRSTLALFRGNIAQSFQYNILCIPFTVAIIISVCWLTLDLVNKKETFFKTINKPIKIIYLVPFFIITAISWYINILRGI